jgi:hypothetical protein
MSTNSIGMIVKKESTTICWTKIRNIFGAKQISNINTIEITGQDINGNPATDPEIAVTWKMITSQRLIEAKLLDRNIIHFQHNHKDHVHK